MSREHITIVAIAVLTAISIATALRLADGSTWPAALLAGLAAGGAVLWGLLGWLGRRPKP